MNINKHTPLLALLFAIASSAVMAQNSGSQAGQAIDPSAQLVDYPAAFFSRYNPNTALDMVRQVPGFQLDDGSSDRGFISAVGNILINDKYPSVKQDTPTAMLARIPANQIEKIELIRGQVREIDLQGRSLVINVILKDTSKASVRWETFIQHSNRGPIKPIASISLSDRWQQTDYNVGFNVERESNGEEGTDYIYNSAGRLSEIRRDKLTQTGLKQMDLFLNTSSMFSTTRLQFNGKATFKNGPENQLQSREPQITGRPSAVFFKDSQNTPSFELGLTADQELATDLKSKAILLYTYSDFNVINLQQNTNADGLSTLLRIADTETRTREAIGRVEFDWAGITNHNLQFNMEAAYNSVEGLLAQTDDTGTGPVIVEVPGANSLVEETRGDFSLKDTWNLGKFELDYGLGAEVSRITQTGDTEQQRDFFFLKPQATLTWSPVAGQQTRLLLLRDIAQLDFDDFISATVFEDDDLALGNPDLRPDTTWVSELSHEYRYNSRGVIKLTAFHHWIRDVLDLLPLSETFEAPGNIGDGRRWGMILEFTVPLDWSGLHGARLDIKSRWQDSAVTDPVTGRTRILSAAQVGFGGPPQVRFADNGSRYIYDIAYRQDLEQLDMSWGVDFAMQSSRPQFKVNELEVYDEGTEINAFVETTRWFGIKLRLEGNNLLDYSEIRNRTIYAGERDLTPVASQIDRDRMAGRRIKLVLSGSF